MLTRKRVVASALATLLLAGMSSQSWAGFEPGPPDDGGQVAAGVTYDAVFAALGNGLKVSGSLRGELKEGWAGVFRVDLFEKGAFSHSVNSYCTNITHPTHIGDKYQVTSQLADCKVAYLVNHYPPLPVFPGMTKTQANNEAAARQAAVWHFADGFTINSPDVVKARAGELITEVNNTANCDAIPQPVEIALSPASQVALSGSPFYYTITATQDGQPVAGLAVDVTATSGALSGTTFTTDSKGKARFSITSPDPATTVVEAKAVYVMPSGTLFQGLNPEQQILVFGSNEVQRGIATGAASATWQSPQGSIIVDIFHDRNINGKKDGESEEDLKDIPVHLIDATGKVIATVNTDGSGLATFPNVPNGTYTVSYVLPTNHLDTNDSADRLKTTPYVRSVSGQ
ncbi:MAG: SdrD B-like domain-containing protein [Thiotrichaceae bacterium]